MSHLRSRYAPAVASIAIWKGEASAAAGHVNAEWTPFASRLAAWVEQFVAASEGADLLTRLDAAEDALRGAERVLREERLEPIVEHAKRIWSALRQESNVDILDIDLTGQNTSRHVTIKAAVDGVAAGALSVLSQGELHALALALFLPRAAMAASPFQFIILDDPVQAMDPAKVDGLLTVLSELAKTHQVIVLSHDDRLAQAARRSSSPARILEVTRQAGSVLTIADAQHPSQRYLDDALALAKDDKVPEATRRLVLPGVLRQALEAAAYQRYFELQLGTGMPLHEVEQQWAANPTTRKRVELALGSYAITSWRDREAGRKEALGLCSAGMHTGLTGDILTRIRGVEKTVHSLEDGRP